MKMCSDNPIIFLSESVEEQQKKWFVNPIKIGVTLSARMKTILGQGPAIFNFCLNETQKNKL